MRIVSSILVCARSALQNPTKIFEYYSRQCWSYSQNEEVYHTFLPCTFLCKDFEGKHISKCVPTRDPAVLIPLTWRAQYFALLHCLQLLKVEKTITQISCNAKSNMVSRGSKKKPWRHIYITVSKQSGLLVFSILFQFGLTVQ